MKIDYRMNEKYNNNKLTPVNYIHEQLMNGGLTVHAKMA